MRNTILTLMSLAAAVSVPAANAQFSGFLSPVSITYTCGTQAGSLPKCTTSYQVPRGRLLVIQDVNGSATPINPNGAGNFATDQASLLISTQVADEAAVTNTIGPHYAIANTAVWNFHELTTFYTDVTPKVYNNGGNVVLNGYLIVY